MICWGARVEAMADYADYARKRDKGNALTERGAGRRGDLGDGREAGSNPLAREPRSVSAYKTGPGEGDAREPNRAGSVQAEVSPAGQERPHDEPGRVAGASEFRCTRDDIDETGGAA